MHPDVFYSFAKGTDRLHLPQPHTEVYTDHPVNSKVLWKTINFHREFNIHQAYNTSSMQYWIFNLLNQLNSFIWTHYLLVNLCIYVPLSMLYCPGPAWNSLLWDTALLFQIIYLSFYISPSYWLQYLVPLLSVRCASFMWFMALRVLSHCLLWSQMLYQQLSYLSPLAINHIRYS